MFRAFSHIGVRRDRGFSLVEVMVGMSIGLLSVLVIMQAFSVFEGQKRTTTAGSDAQENGLMALVLMEQVIRNAGAGFSDSSAFDCNTINSYYNGTPNAPGIPTTSMAPVKIADGGASGSDTVTILSGTEFLGSIPATITSSMPVTSSALKVDRTIGFNGTNGRCSGCAGDLILVSQGGACTVMQVTNANAASLTLTLNNGSNAPYNPAGNFYNTSPGNTWPTYTTGAKILNMGSLSSFVFSIDSGNNLQEATGSAAAIPLVTGIVSLQAQYGVSSAVGVQQVSSWVDATAATGFNTLDSSKVKRIKAVRIVAVARSGKKELSNVTGQCTNTSGAVNNGPCAWSDSVANPAPVIDLSANPDWQKYRYRVYQTIIPLRNIIWANL